MQNYIDKIKGKLNANNFQQLITQKLGASFLRYLPLNFLLNDPIFNDNSVVRNAFVLVLAAVRPSNASRFSATWLSLLSPLQRDAISNKVYRVLSDTTSNAVPNDGPLRLNANDPSTLDMIARIMPSLSTRQIIRTVGDKIVRRSTQSSG